jgi:hypothetical protein
LSKTAQYTYSSIEISPALGDANATYGTELSNTDAERLPDVPERDAIPKEIAHLRMYADAKNSK